MSLRDVLEGREDPSQILDVIGKTCPYPVLEAGKTLREMEPGDILEVQTDFEPSVRTGLPRFCEKHGCEYEHVEEGTSSEGNPAWKFYIEKSDSPTIRKTG